MGEPFGRGLVTGAEADPAGDDGVRLWFGVSLLLALFLFFFQLGGFPLFDLDEAIYAESAREMLVSGDWLTPRYNERPFFDKPILIYWLTAGAYALFGVNEFAARLPSALCGLGLLVVVFGFLRTAAGPRLALLALLILATSLETITLAHAALTDMPLILTLTAGMAAFYLGFERRAWRWFAAGYVAFGLAALVKGPVAVALPALIFTVYTGLQGRFREFVRRARLPLGALIFLAVAAPWYAAMVQLHGWPYVEAFFLKHNVRRFTGVIAGHAGSPFYYLGVLVVGFFPWSAFLPAALVSSWPRRWVDWQPVSSMRRLEMFALVWAAGVILFFSLASTKLPNYIGPLLPAVAILTARWWERLLDGDVWPRRTIGWSAAILVAIAGLFAVLLALVPVWIRFAPDRYALAAPYLIEPIELRYGPELLAAVLLVGSIAVALALRRERILDGFLRLILVVGMFAFMLLAWVVPIASGYIQGPLRDLAQAAGAALPPDGRLITVGLKKPSVPFYAGRVALALTAGEDARLRQELSRPGPVMLLGRESDVGVLSNYSDLRLRARRGGYLLYANF